MYAFYDPERAIREVHFETKADLAICKVAALDQSQRDPRPRVKKWFLRRVPCLIDEVETGYVPPDVEGGDKLILKQGETDACAESLWWERLYGATEADRMLARTALDQMPELPVPERFKGVATLQDAA